MNPLLWPEALIGKPGSRYELITPALVLDLDLAKANMHKLTRSLFARGLRLRANAKTHKSSPAARFQIAHGAIGVCCATIGEAAVMMAAGLEGVLLTTPMTTRAKIGAAIDLRRKANLMLTVDHVENAAELSLAATQAGVQFEVLVDVDPGSHRTGVARDQDAMQLVAQVQRSPGLIYAGLQCYAGSVQHIENAGERAAQNRRVLARLRGLVDALTVCGSAPRIVSGGGTGSFDTDDAFGVLTESQAGSFMFMDVQYLDVWRKQGLEPPFATALHVQTAVHSASHRGFVTTDAGSKRFATDGGRVLVDTPLPVPVEYRFHGDEHGKVHFADGGSHLRIGDRIECVVSHCDPTINLYDRIHCVRADVLVDVWPIDARGV